MEDTTYLEHSGGRDPHVVLAELERSAKGGDRLWAAEVESRRAELEEELFWAAEDEFSRAKEWEA